MQVKSVFSAGLLSLVLLGNAQAQTLPAYKDELFNYPAVLKNDDKGDYRIIDYNEMRDINGRDSTPEKRVKDNYVSLKPRAFQKDLVLDTPAGPVKAMAAGQIDNARFVVIYLHGRGGNRLQGMNDFTFGGNFNRVKNLAVLNGGLYLTPDFSDFADKGTAQIAGLIAWAANRSPAAKIILACGSQGGSLCWSVAKDATAAKQLSGMMLLGSLWDDGFFKSPAYAKKIPIFFGHGSRDPVFAIDRQEGFYREIRKRSPGYPVQFRRFETGNHGTPIRMTDWREALNWLLAR